MTQRLIHLLSCSFLVACFLFLLSSCNEHDDLVVEAPPTDGTDAKGRPIYTCTGALCYDPDDPVQIAAKQSMADALNDILPDREAEVLELLNDMEERYAACNYQQDSSTSLIRVDCPPWVGDATCPYDFFASISQGKPITPRRAAPSRQYCVQPKTRNSWRNCEKNLSCPNGEVCSGALTGAFGTDEQKPRGSFVCLPPKACQELQSKYRVSPAESCLYSDFTEVAYPEYRREMPDCDELPEGTCTHTCSCASEKAPTKGSPARCEMLSEKSALGVCSNYKACELDRDCLRYGSGICANHASLPTWAKAHYQRIFGRSKARFPTGFCIAESACEAWNEENGDQLTCGAVIEK